MKKVEQYEIIRRDWKDQGLSIRELSRKHKVHRRDIRAALNSAAPPSPKTRQRQSIKLGPYKEQIITWLKDDKLVSPKQRHTARRIWQRLVDEYGADVSEGYVRQFVANQKKIINNNYSDVAIAQQHQQGFEAEVDFGEFYVWLEGIQTKLHLFVMRLSASGKAFHVAFANCGQEAFLEGHVRAFEYFGGVPTRIRYDNLKAAVITVLLGRQRLENERFIALRSHYGFDSFYCMPGIKGAHEKGGVEGEIGRFRRNHLTPIPQVNSLGELNELIASANITDDKRHIGSKKTTVGYAFEVEKPYLTELPQDIFDTTTQLRRRVDANCLVSVKGNFYSVPVGYAGKSLLVHISVDQITIYDNNKIIASHERAIRKGQRCYVLDHYLEVLLRKPGAFANAVALDQARKDGVFSDTHEKFWNEARKVLGDRSGTKEIVEVLLLQRDLGLQAVVAGMQKALTISSVDHVIVGIEARRNKRREQGQVVSIETASRYDRPAPNIGAYDELLEVVK